MDISAGRYDVAIKNSADLLKVGLEAIRYLQTYDWLFLRTLVTIGYAGFVAFAFTTIIDLYVLRGSTSPQRTFVSNAVFSSTAIALFSLMLIQRSPWTYYLYASFPIFFWEDVYARRSAWRGASKTLLGNLNKKDLYLGLGGSIVAVVGVLEALAQSYYQREVFTICYTLAAAWPAMYGMDFLNSHKTLSTTWALSCLMMSTFTLLPAIKTESINLILIGGILMFSVGVLYLLLEKSIIIHRAGAKSAFAEAKADYTSRAVLGGQVGLIALAMLVTRSSVASLQARKGLPLGTQVVGWLVLITSLSIPFLHGLQPNNHYLHRLVVIFLTFSPVFIILTISYEGLFYFAYCTLLVTWVRLEYHIYRHQLAKAVAIVRNANANGASTSSGSLTSITAPLLDKTAEAELSATAKQHNPSAQESKAFRELTIADFRISLFFLYLLTSAFFSTGNIASISSFSLDAVYRLIPIFDPFSQGALLLLKLMIPFAIISANLGILNKLLGLGPGVLGMIGVVMGDWLTVRFFWAVKDEGSWLEIGESITKFVIASMLGVFVAGLEVVGEVFVGGVEVDGEHEVEEGDGDKKKRQ